MPTTRSSAQGCLENKASPTLCFSALTLNISLSLGLWDWREVPQPGIPAHESVRISDVPQTSYLNRQNTCTELQLSAKTRLRRCKQRSAPGRPGRCVSAPEPVVTSGPGTHAPARGVPTPPSPHRAASRTHAPPQPARVSLVDEMERPRKGTEEGGRDFNRVDRCLPVGRFLESTAPRRTSQASEHGDEPRTTQNLPRDTGQVGNESPEILLSYSVMIAAGRERQDGTSALVSAT